MSTEYVEYSSARPLVPPRSGFSWSGIFAGTFLFLAIEATFGALAAAIFTQTRPVGVPTTWGIGIGAGVWMIILSIIAMYFGARLAARLSGAVTADSGRYAGLVTFGVVIFSLILIAEMALGSPIGGVGAGLAATTHVGNILAANGWYLFVGLILSMISAAWGGMMGSGLHGRRLETPLEHPVEPRKAA